MSIKRDRDLSEHIHMCMCVYIFLVLLLSSASPMWWWRFSLSVVSDSLWPHGDGTPGSSVHRIFQTRILEWVAISFSRASSWPKDLTWVSCIASRLNLNSKEKLSKWDAWVNQGFLNFAHISYIYRRFQEKQIKVIISFYCHPKLLVKCAGFGISFE